MKQSYVILLLSVLLGACNFQDSSFRDTPTSGIIYCGADESLREILDQEIFVFGSLYKYASVNPSYLPGESAFKYLRNDSCRFILVTRAPDQADSSWFASIKITPRYSLIASDGIVLIVHPENPVKQLSYKELEALCNGDLNKWNAFEGRSDTGKIKLVFDHEESGIVRSISDRFFKKDSLPKNFFALRSEKEVIDYISEDRFAIGFISMNIFAEDADSNLLEMKSKISMVSLADSAATGYYKPDQSSIATGKYPLSRRIFLVSREARTGLATGFTSFLVGEKGQRIILKAGLVPEAIPQRRISTYE